MISEETISYLIYTHSSLGGIALLAGLMAIVAKKGTKLHKMSGKIFFLSMLVSAVCSLLISTQTNHNNPFLIAIGIFTLYFIISGYRALKLKRKNVNLLIDKIISWIMVITGLLMILLPLIFNGRINIVLAAFGFVGTVLSFQDLNLYRKKHLLNKRWINQHLTKMLGGYISTFTAFIVVNQLLPSMVGWFAPSVVGSLYIVYWIRKLRKRQT